MITNLPVELYESLLSLDDRVKTVRLINSSVLLLSAESFWNLLHTSHRELWEGVRSGNPSLPVAKTMERLLGSPFRPLGRSAMIRLIRGLPPSLIDESLRPHHPDYVWPVGAFWIGMFSSGLFQNNVAKAFWVQFARDATVLNAETLRTDQGMGEMWRRYASSPLVHRFGCTALWAGSAKMDYNESYKEQAISRCLSADTFTMLLRVLAWYVADKVVENFWDAVEREDMSDVTPFECIIPVYEPLSGEWSNPMLGALEHLGKLCGWQQKQKVTTYLGNRWANCSGPNGVEGPARIKLLRYWVQAKRGRPKFQTFLDLVCTVTRDSSRLKNTDPDERAYDNRIQASILRLGETIALVRLHLTSIGLTHDEVESVMSAYAQEYRVARTALGRSMKPRD